MMRRLRAPRCGSLPRTGNAVGGITGGRDEGSVSENTVNRRGDVENGPGQTGVDGSITSLMEIPGRGCRTMTQHMTTSQQAELRPSSPRWWELSTLTSDGPLPLPSTSGTCRCTWTEREHELGRDGHGFWPSPARRTSHAVQRQRARAHDVPCMVRPPRTACSVLPSQMTISCPPLQAPCLTAG